AAGILVVFLVGVLLGSLWPPFVWVLRIVSLIVALVASLLVVIGVLKPDWKVPALALVAMMASGSVLARPSIRIFHQLVQAVRLHRPPGQPSSTTRLFLSVGLLLVVVVASSYWYNASDTGAAVRRGEPSTGFTALISFPVERAGVYGVALDPAIESRCLLY